MTSTEFRRHMLDSNSGLVTQAIRQAQDENVPDPPDDLADARAAVLDALEWLGQADHDREVCHFTCPGLPHYLLMTGGMSWGDAPTEAMEFMDTLCGCKPVWSRIEAWALEDAAATSGVVGAGEGGSGQGA